MTNSAGFVIHGPARTGATPTPMRSSGRRPKDGRRRAERQHGASRAVIVQSPATVEDAFAVRFA
jgi:hypothetical protein